MAPENKSTVEYARPTVTSVGKLEMDLDQKNKRLEDNI